MHRSFDIFRTSPNGVDPDRGTAPAGQQGVQELHGYDPTATTYGNTPYADRMYSAPLPEGQVWRGRDEQHDFWGYDRQPGHPSLWDRVKGVFHGKGPKNYVRSDERIREDACEQLAYHPYVDATDIEVIVREGEVTLTGTVDARMVKRAAEDAVDHVRGVRDVHNHLRVRRAEPLAAPEAEKLNVIG